jgi:hypothetical protein
VACQLASGPRQPTPLPCISGCDCAIAVRTVAVSNHRQLQRHPKWKVEVSDSRSGRQASDTILLGPQASVRGSHGATAAAAMAGSDQAPGRPPIPQMHSTSQTHRGKKANAHQPSGLLPGPTRGLGRVSTNESTPYLSPYSSNEFHNPRISHLVRWTKPALLVFHFPAKLGQIQHVGWAESLW